MEYSFDSRVRYSEIGEDKKITLNAILNYFQDCSTFQSEELGLGLEYMEKEEKLWVLSSWQIVVDRYPAMAEKISIHTWSYELKRALGSRNFVMKDEAGVPVAYANSLWAYVDMKTGMFAKVSDDQKEAYGQQERFPMEYAPKKIAVPKDFEMKEAFTVKPHHLDTNHHVNNGQYIMMAMGYVPSDFKVHQMRAEYKKQAVLNDVIIPKIHEENGIYTIMLCTEDDTPYVIVELKQED